MVAKMKYISITGHIGSMNHVVNKYLSRYDIQLEQTTQEPMEPFTTLNPYSLTLQKAERLKKMLPATPYIYRPMTVAQAVNMVEEAAQAYDQRSEHLRELEEKLREAQDYINRLQDFTAFNTDLSVLGEAEFTHFRFGRLAHPHFLQFEKFLTNDEKIAFEVIKRDTSHTWGVYLTPKPHKDTTDAVFASLKFEYIDISDTCLGEKHQGTPTMLIDIWKGKCFYMEHEILNLSKNLISEITAQPQNLAIACERVQDIYARFDVKKYAALSKNKRVFTFTGWMAEDEAHLLETEIVYDELVVFSHSPEHEHPKPPTILKNPPLIRQFEFFTRLYGLPTYGELDPTPILAVTYTILFGLMFGDVGHGLALSLLGMYIRYKWKKPLGGIMILIGVSACGFGFLYGSIFGNEEILSALWRRPASNITETLIFAAGLGVVLITLSMGLHMYNAIRQGRMADFLFGANGLAGLTFYGAALWLGIRSIVFNMPITTPVVLVALFPLIFVAFKHPLETLMSGKPLNIKAGEFIFNTVIEVFETLLTYATNTISFVRVGAFAISHAGMMHVVIQLSQGSAGAGSFIIFILGNVLVMSIEGLLVGIQVLRLDFYELFSRFYAGGGRAFTSHKIARR